MKLFLLSVTAFLIALALASLSSAGINEQTRILSSEKKSIISCSPDRNELVRILENSDIPPMPGAGFYKWYINSKSDSAQFYFNQGINMYYGFHIIEALASFKKASRLDPGNPMVWWAQALALGPNINDVGYTASPEALATTENAVQLSNTAKPVEKMLIRAMSVRYSNDSTQSREKLNQQYADAMKTAYESFAYNADVAALYADALMLQHPWDLWNNDGSPKPWTPKIRQVLEKLLAKAPAHPGANHYYIHTMEASPYASLAVSSADRLGKLTPGLSHMVHMPSHIYLRVGQFNRGTEVNEKAVNRYGQYKTLFPAVADNMFLYEWHNLHMQVNCAMLAGRYGDGYKTSVQLQSAIDPSALSIDPPLGSYVQYVYMTPMLMNVRFHKWDELLTMKEPPVTKGYAGILFHFGKGFAYAATNKISEAENARKQIIELMKDENLTIPIKPFSAAIEGAKVAEQMLAGFIAEKQNHFNDAIEHYKKAASIEADMVYNEPRDWFISPKQYLGAVYLKAGRWKDAQMIFEKDLKVNADNVWSLHGLQQALSKQKKNGQAAVAKAKLTRARIKTDVNLQKLL